MSLHFKPLCFAAVDSVVNLGSTVVLIVHSSSPVQFLERQYTFHEGSVTMDTPLVTAVCRVMECMQLLWAWFVKYYPI